jgi:hypothetical protein
MEERPAPCCKAWDTDPRHVILYPDGTDVAYHLDCCADQNNCDLCKAQIAGWDGQTGEGMRRHLLSLAPKLVNHGGADVHTVAAIQEVGS